jgi:hypothetical protein
MKSALDELSPPLEQFRGFIDDVAGLVVEVTTKVYQLFAGTGQRITALACFLAEFPGILADYAAGISA